MTAIVFIPTGEVRRAEPGEWWLSKEGYCCRIDSIKISMDEHPILTRYEIEPTPDVLRALGMEGKDAT